MIVYVLVGMLIAILGIAINRFKMYCLVSGYNLMNEKNKNKFDIKSYTNFQEKIFLIGGLLIVVSSLLCYYLNNMYILDILFISIILMIVIALFVYSNKCCVSKSINRLKYYVLFICLFLAGAMLYLGLKSPKYFVEDGYLRTNGLYSLQVKIDNIESINLLNRIPEDITNRVNGFSLMGVRKGYYISKSYGKVKLLVNSKASNCIYVKTKDGKNYLFSDINNRKTKLLLEKIR